MDNFLNLVYDSWESDGVTPIANGYKFCCENGLPCCEDIHTKWLFWKSHEVIRYQLDYENYKIRRLEDVSNHPEEMFFYLVWFRSSFKNGFFKKNLLPLSTDVLQVIKTHQNINIIFMNEQEAEDIETLTELTRVVDLYEIDPKRVWFMDNNERLGEYKNRIHTGINVHTTRSIFYSARKSFYDFGKEFNQPQEEKRNLFLVHNRSPKSHRLGLLCLLKNRNILHEFDWSLLVNVSFPGEEEYKKYYDEVFSDEDYIKLQSEIEYFKKIRNWNSVYERTKNLFDPYGNPYVMQNMSVPETYKESYFNICTESHFTDDTIHLSEKTYKPFMFLQYPMILASYQHIKFTKEMHHFDFFDDVINHSYDNEIDNHKRMIKFVDELVRIQQNKKFFIEFYRKNKDRFLANQNIIKTINNDHDASFFNGLSAPK